MVCDPSIPSSTAAHTCIKFGIHSDVAARLRESLPRMEATVNACLVALTRKRFHGFWQCLMRTASGTVEPFVNLDWAPGQLKAEYPPSHLDGADCGASPIVFAFRNGQLCRGRTGIWCAGSASWLIVKKGPVLVVGIDLDQCIKDARPLFIWIPLNTGRRHSMPPAWARSDPPLHPHTHVATLPSSCTCVDAHVSTHTHYPPHQVGSQEPVSNLGALEDKMLSGDYRTNLATRIKFQILCWPEQVVWVPQGTAVALLGLAEGGMSAVAYFPWLSRRLAKEHRDKNAICAKSVAKVALTTMKSHSRERAYGLVLTLQSFFDKIARDV